MIDGKKVRARREARQMTQQEAGVAAGFTASAARIRWSDLESGKIPDPRVSTAAAVARALGCAVDELLREREEKQKRGKR